MASEEGKILQPKPRRIFSTSPINTEPSSPTNEPASPQSGAMSPLTSSQMAAFQASRTRSVLNLTASTLYGIYAPDDDASVLGYTPMPTNGATTPAYPPTPSLLSQSQFEFDKRERDAHRETDRMAPVIGALERPQFRATPSYQRAQNRGSALVRAGKGLVRAALLFALGVAYGTVVTHLHDSRDIAPVKLDGLNRSSPSYTIFWGLAGILLGTALPVVDAIWEGESPEEKRERLLMQKSLAATTAGRNPPGGAPTGRDAEGDSPGNPLAEAIGLGAEWNPIVRSIGAFIGIGFAIRRLPWQSTLQASVTLGLANPCLWYTIDRSLPGFALSSAVGVLGTMVLLGTEVVPMPAIVTAAVGANNANATGAAATAAANAGSPVFENLPLGIDQGTFAVWIWISSVLFCSCLCFGNIGRRLALGMNER